MTVPLTSLPIDPFVPEIVELVRRHRAAVITAEPGAGKTTRVPPALAADGPVILLQPRRVAARSIARRIAEEQGWTIGREVGWHVRFDRQVSSTTSLVVATEGILTARLQQDPLLSDVRTIVIDEFHERSLHADLGLAMARQAWIARDDLRLVVMSATIDASRVAAFLDDCPVVSVPGRTFAIDVSYHPGVAMEQAVVDIVPRVRGAVLCFLPGAPEIRRVAERVSSAVARGVDVLPLHGGLDADEQDRAVRPGDRPRIILATNLAETTLTVPDVTGVIDGGRHKVARYDAERLVDSLEVERITQDSADQRAGRAGRVQAGWAMRLWDARDRLRPHREPEIARVDLASVVLDILAWGSDPRTFPWFDAPPAAAIDAAMRLHARLGSTDARGALTELGRALQALPLHPRLGRLLLAADAAPVAARACALLAERHSTIARHGATSCDLFAAVDREQDLPPHVVRVAREIGRAAERALGRPAARAIDEETFRRAVLAAYPDRVAQRREPRSPRVLLASGTGAEVSRDSGVIEGEFLVAVDVAAVGTNPVPLIRMATRIERDWLVPTGREVRLEFDAGREAVRAVSLDMYDAIVLRERVVPADPAAAAEVIAREYIRRGPGDEDTALLRRLTFADRAMTFEELVTGASAGARGLKDIDLAAHLAPEVRRALDRLAPADLALPGGRRARLEYRDDGRVVAAVRIQQVFGLTATPRVGPKQTPITFELLAPNGRPVQVTSDLTSFWSGAYLQLRPALRARYPKHKW